MKLEIQKFRYPEYLEALKIFIQRPNTTMQFRRICIWSVDKNDFFIKFILTMAAVVQ